MNDTMEPLDTSWSQEHPFYGDPSCRESLSRPRKWLLMLTRTRWSIWGRKTVMLSYSYMRCRPVGGLGGQDWPWGLFPAIIVGHPISCGKGVLWLLATLSAPTWLRDSACWRFAASPELRTLRDVFLPILDANFYCPFKRENFPVFSRFFTLLTLFFFVYMMRKRESSLFWADDII